MTLLSVIIVAIIVPYLCGYKIGYYTNIKYDYDAIAAWAQVLGVLLTSILTVMIIFQAKTIAKNQLEFEKKSSDNQLQFEKISALNQETFLRRQIKIDLFERRVVIFEWVFKLFTYIDIIVKLQKGEAYLEKNYKKIINILKHMKSEDKLDILFLHRADYLFPKDLAVKMVRIIKLYTDIGALVNISSEEMGFDLSKFNQEFYDEILKKCNEILSYQNFVTNACDSILNIAEFDRM